MYSNTTLHVPAECLICIYLMKGRNNHIAGLHSRPTLKCKKVWLVKLSCPSSVTFRQNSFKKWHFLSKITLDIKAISKMMVTKLLNEIKMKTRFFPFMRTIFQISSTRKNKTYMRYKTSLTTQLRSWFANYILYSIKKATRGLMHNCI